jgi:hypothetical protein
LLSEVWAVCQLAPDPKPKKRRLDEFSCRTIDDLYHSTPATVNCVISPPSGAMPGDLDFNNAVNLADLALLVGGFGLNVGDTPHPGDLDGDGRIGMRDVISLRNAFALASPGLDR